MLWNREDAEDATQEILVRTVTRLSQFDFRSKLKTWVYRIAVNYILDVKKSAVERLHLTFEMFADDLLDGGVIRWSRRCGAVIAHRGSESRMHARHAAVPGPTASIGVRPRRDLRPGGT